MEKLGDVYLDFNQNETNIDDLNLNAVWVDLDKGLLSDNIGLQCEFIVKLTDLFEKFPLPVFVNSGFLRLAKIFQNGSNYLKLQVIRVIEKNQKHLQKILSVDEICKLIFYNIHSNDSVCRALTLRALADISLIISDHHNVQHSIRLALESHDELEAKQAIYAANKFSSISKSFAASLFDGLSEIIEDTQSPLDRKLKLIPLLVHMHHDTALSAKAKNLCKAMYYVYPRADISAIILNTLTLIACRSLSNIFETVTFLIKLLEEEPRQKLQLILLKNLRYLANNVAHLWTVANINSLISYMGGLEEEADDLVLIRSSDILYTLALRSNVHFYFVVNSSVVAANSVLVDTDKLKILIEKMTFHENKSIALNFCLFSETVLAYHHRVLVKQQQQQQNSSSIDAEFLYEMTKNGIFALILKCDKELRGSDEMASPIVVLKVLKQCLKSCVGLVQMRSDSYLEELYTFIASLLNNIETRTANVYCDTLLTLCRFDNFNYETRKQEYIANVFIKLKEYRDSNLQLKLINLLFELQVRKLTNFSAYNSPGYNIIRATIAEFIAANIDRQWPVFKLARMCVRYSYYEMANKLFESITATLSEPVTDTSNNVVRADLNCISWLEFMSILCKAEYLIGQSNVADINEFIGNLNRALQLYNQAQALFKANCSKCFWPCPRPGVAQQACSQPALENSNTCIQMRFCELRSEQIKLYVHLILSTMTYQTIPAPVFHFKSSQNFGRFGRIAQQMKYSLAEMQKLTQKYKELVSECFDADCHTLNVLNVYKRQNECLMFCINLLSCHNTEKALTEEFAEKFLKKNADGTADPNSTSCNSTSAAELKIMQNFYANLYEKIKLLCKQEQDSQVKINQIKQFQEILIDFIRLPVSLPRIFFNTMQRTQIKLIVSPNAKKPNTIVTIRSDQSLVIKIDGIVNQQSQGLSPIRKIKKVQVCLTIELDTKVMPANETKFLPAKYSDIKTSLEEPRNDYFSCSMLLNFPYVGNYNIQIDLYIVDELDMFWHYLAEKQNLPVKVEEDPARQKLFAALAAAASTSNNNNLHLQQQQHQQQNYNQRITPVSIEEPIES